MFEIHKINSFLIIAIFAISIISSAPIQIPLQAETYLSKFGYLSALIPFEHLDSATLTKALMDFQSFANLNTTGNLDTKTIEQMSRPRCGFKDKIIIDPNSRSKRYALTGGRWESKHLTYTISKYPKRLNQEIVNREIARAFNVWSEFIGITFIAMPINPVDIEIRFESYQHGDFDPFDGPGGILAHANFPIYGGDVHFDEDENWTIDTKNGINLYQVAVHEFGHSLGLSHSDVLSSIMVPFYRDYSPNFYLGIDDIQGIQTLYNDMWSQLNWFFFVR